MDGNRGSFFKQRPSTQFKRKGSYNYSNRRQVNNPSREFLSVTWQPSETVYRILCPSRKIGGVIGKGGGIVKALREETRAKITVSDSVAGSDERVILIYSPPTKISRKKDTDEVLNEAHDKDPIMQPHCAAQEALMKVHDRIVEEDLFAAETIDGDTEENVVTVRLLVPNNLVGCLLGKQGEVIQRLRNETGAIIRVLPADHLPACAVSTDELVQISGKPDVAKNALYEVSTLLHQNPRKDKPPLSFGISRGGLDFHPPSSHMTDMLPPGNPVWCRPNSSSRCMPPMPWMGDYENHPTEFRSRGFNGIEPGHGGEASAEFSIKMLCSVEKIGGVIGKGGLNLKQLWQETGAAIHVEDALTESYERIIGVSAFEALWNPRSQTIDAILQLQNQTAEYTEDGHITTRLLVPSNKVGCILGQGGQVINEMRRRTRADIRVYSKEDKPKCASEDEELVQISGNFGVAKDALAEIASRLRVRSLRDANAAADPPIDGNLTLRRHGSSDVVRAGSSGGSEPFKGRGLDFEPQIYPIPSAATTYPNVHSAFEARIPHNAMTSITGVCGNNFSSMAEADGERMKLQGLHSGISESMAEIRGSSDRLTAAQGVYQSFSSSPGENMNPQGSYHQNVNAQQASSYADTNARRSTYQNINASHGSYQQISAADQVSYPYVNIQHCPYAQHGSHPNTNAQQGHYQHISSEQGSYQY